MHDGHPCPFYKGVPPGFLLHMDQMLAHHRVTLGIKFAGTHLYTLVERGLVRVKGLPQGHCQHNVLSQGSNPNRSMQK